MRKLSQPGLEHFLREHTAYERIACRRIGRGARWRGWDYVCRLDTDRIYFEVDRAEIVNQTAP